MTRSIPTQEWILLIHQLPPKPTNLRVRVWRKLQRLGAVLIKSSVYVLPSNEKAHEDFQWLKQEIEASGGEASVFRAASVEGITDDEIIASFRQQRAEDYARVTAELDGLVGALREQKRGNHLSAIRLGDYEAALDKLHIELERIKACDFFGADNGARAVAAYVRCRKILHDSEHRESKTKNSKSSDSTSLALAPYQGARWVTRRNLHIDRLASAWLIKRFIDNRPRFFFVADHEAVVENGIPFDMFGAEFGHHGEDCTFETMIKRFGFDNDIALRNIAEIVHDIDLKDDKFHRLEAAGLDALVRGLAALFKNDRKLIQQCRVIFDGLYTLLKKNAEHKEKEVIGKRPIRRRINRRESKRK